MNAEKVYLGWDVGGWNCDKNSKSRDALVFLDANRKIMGVPWRGNLAATINQSDDQVTFLKALFRLCELEYQHQKMLLAIDTPLCFSDGFRNLLNGTFSATGVTSSQNPYLFRQCERLLAERGFKPLSAIKDMIGAQATKGIHALAKFVPDSVSTGVWQHQSITAIEAYPSPCRESKYITALTNMTKWPLVSAESEGPLMTNGKVRHQDHIDALICALIGWSFDKTPEALWQPSESAPVSEGWIFLPKDCFGHSEE